MIPSECSIVENATCLSPPVVVRVDYSDEEDEDMQYLEYYF